MFEANPAFFDPEDKSSRVSHSLLITYTTPISDSMPLRMMNSDRIPDRIEVNWLEMTPSLKKAMHEAFTARRG